MYVGVWSRLGRTEKADRRLRGTNLQWCESCRNAYTAAGPLYADRKPPHRRSIETAAFHRLSRPSRRGGERIGHFRCWPLADLTSHASDVRFREDSVAKIFWSAREKLL